jgi:hypothetical protein
MGQPVYVSDTNQLVIDANGDANINASDFRINLTGTTAYDDADVVYYITSDLDTARTYTLGDGADSFTGNTGTIIDTVIGNGGNDTITGGPGADIISGGAGADNITGGAGVDSMTGGAGNDVIVTTDAEADIVAFVATTASAPYVVANNGTDTVTMFVDGAEGNFEIDFDNLNDVAGNYTGTDDYDLLEADGTPEAKDQAIDPVQGLGTSDIQIAGSIIVLDTNVADEVTASDVAGYIEGTGDTFALTASNSAIIVTGNETGAKIQIWWIDSLIDGDGSDVTTADVHLLIQSAGDHNVDQLMANQLDVGLA